MNGIKYIFDTNAAIAFFSKSADLSRYVFMENKLALSVISILEFLSFKSLTEQEKELFFEFCNLSDVIDVTYKDSELLELISTIRINYKLKLPDAIIAASAIVNNATLITNDQHFANIPNLQILTF